MSTKASPWQPVEGDAKSILAQCLRPLDDLAAGEIPALVLRGAYPADSCRKLIARLIDEELLYDPHQPIPDKFREAAIPEGYYREGRQTMPSFAWRSQPAKARTRIDIGTSLGYRGSDKEAFLAHCRQTEALFARLFGDDDNPVRLLYNCLEQLSCDKRVVTACEPDGKRYGPAIIRAHYGGYTYKPHFDSVRLREKRSDYAVCEFEHQFAEFSCCRTRSWPTKRPVRFAPLLVAAGNRDAPAKRHVSPVCPRAGDRKRRSALGTWGFIFL